MRLSGYVHTLVPLWHDAEDVLQNTKIRLWEQFDQFELGTDFAAWAFTIAGYMVRTYRKQSQRQRLCFRDDLLEKIEKHIPVSSSSCENRVSALLKCVELLSSASRQLLHMVYVDRRKVRDIACASGEKASAVYQRISRARRTLQECIEQRMRQEGGGR